MSLLKIIVPLMIGMVLTLGCDGADDQGDTDADSDTDTDADTDSDSDSDTETSTCDDYGEDADPESQVPLLALICEALIEKGFADKCGDLDDQCVPSDTSCIQLYGSENDIGPYGDVNICTSDPPQDLYALFGMIDFLPEEAQDSITEEGAYWGNPASETDPYLEIDLTTGDFRIVHGGYPESIDPEDETINESYYEDEVFRYSFPMGVAPSQIDMEITGTMSDDGNGNTQLLKRVAFVYREINQMRLEDDRLLFEFAPADGQLYEISGDWTPINYAGSQFTSDYETIDELADDLIADFAEHGIESAESTDIAMTLAYRLAEGSEGFSLDLVLQYLSTYEIFDFDI